MIESQSDDVIHMRIGEELARAASDGNSKLVLTALRRGAKPNGSYRGRPALLWAIQERKLNTVKILVRAGASLEKRDEHGFTPLNQAVGEGDIKIVRFLLSAGAKVDGRTRYSTPLHTACAYRRLQIAKLLLAHGASVNALDEDGRTPADFTIIEMNKTDKALHRMLNEAQ